MSRLKDFYYAERLAKESLKENFAIMQRKCFSMTLEKFRLDWGEETFAVKMENPFASAKSFQLTWIIDFHLAIAQYLIHR